MVTAPPADWLDERSWAAVLDTRPGPAGLRHRRRARDRPDLPPRASTCPSSRPSRCSTTRRAATLLADYYAATPTSPRPAGAGLLLETPDLAGQPRLGRAAGVRRRRRWPRSTATPSHFARGPRRAVRRRRAGRAWWPALVGPRGDGYVAGDALDPDEARDYHRPQVAGVRRRGRRPRHGAAPSPRSARRSGSCARPRGVGLPVASPSPSRPTAGCPTAPPLARRDRGARRRRPPARLLPGQLRPPRPRRRRPGRDAGPWLGRIAGLRVNASRLSHAELDEAEELDEGDLAGPRGATRPALAARCPACASSAAAAAPTPGTSRRCGGSALPGVAGKAGELARDDGRAGRGVDRAAGRRRVGCSGRRGRTAGAAARTAARSISAYRMLSSCRDRPGEDLAVRADDHAVAGLDPLGLGARRARHDPVAVREVGRDLVDVQARVDPDDVASGPRGRCAASSRPSRRRAPGSARARSSTPCAYRWNRARGM